MSHENFTLCKAYLAVLVHRDSGMLRRYGIVPDSHIAINITVCTHNKAKLMSDMNYKVY